ncbi:hypothetical protein GCM10027066_33450 [Dyella jejuensis]
MTMRRDEGVHRARAMPSLRDVAIRRLCGNLSPRVQQALSAEKWGRFNLEVRV